MKPSAILISAGHGPIVDKVALIAALENCIILAAPGWIFLRKSHRRWASLLLRLSNVVVLPHIGIAIHETRP